MRSKFVVQLYTVRNEIATDFPGTLRELKNMGWAGVQMTVPPGYKAEEIAALSRELGLVTAGMHFPLDRLKNDLDAVVRTVDLFQTKDIICPFLQPEMRTEEGYRQVRSILNEAAGNLAPKGYRLSYHNHAFEFETEIEGKNALEFLLEPQGDHPIWTELDVYWLKKGGRDPLTFISQYAHRMPIIHLKDMTDDERQTFAEVGTGSIDFPPILQWCMRSGVEWLAVEQDICPGDPLDSLRISLDNLNRMADQIEQGVF